MPVTGTADNRRREPDDERLTRQADGSRVDDEKRRHGRDARAQHARHVLEPPGHLPVRRTEPVAELAGADHDAGHRERAEALPAAPSVSSIAMPTSHA
jgi:hypothetical protein